jgi:SAM-dependent methyltransferase
VLCPLCHSHARHRFAFFVTKTNTNLFDGSPKKMLHFAPSEIFEKIFRKIPNLEYITTDIDRPDVTINMDITNIEFTDESFDIIYCSHVLEHVSDDFKAMCELKRIIKSDGWVLLSVPYKEDQKTIEAPVDMSPEDRQRLLGAHNHVRLYGNDLKERLVKAGFSVQQIRCSDIFSTEEAERYRMKGQNIFICTK